ncbi:MAG TPA: GTPase ObgE [Chthoniobacterales bacterium]|jgi:GTP-binding protein|nr:GTPase ObgE [Chthoniobacterales bacterium]
MFVDRIKVVAKAGDGGRGCVSFRREKFVPKGGPDGGDGGKGGDIILRADEHTDNLVSLFYEPLIKAKHGGHGMGKQMHGRGAPDKIVKVPVGTIVYRITAPGDASAFVDGPAPGAAPPAATLEPVADLTAPNDEFILCQGGKGGKGNVHFKSSRNRAPRQYSEGEEGEEGEFLLELRTMADAALVGYPNAGKSTLLRQISAAHPKVAAYPFTTLHPMIGVVDFADYRRATVADIPGLIEGAHRNLGLGHAFLRHITRCRLLLFVLDMAGSEGRNPSEDLQHLRREIDLYDPRLSQRPWRVVANKMDLPEAEQNLADFRQRFPDKEVMAVSAKEQEGIANLKRALDRWLDETRPVGMPEAATMLLKAKYPRMRE